MKLNKIALYLLNLIYSSLMIFYNVLPSFIVVIMSFVLFMYNYFKLSREYNKTIAIFIDGLLFLPVSFVSILATPYSTLPLTWFSISLIILTIIIILKKKLKRLYLLLYFLFLSIFLITIFFSNTLVSAVSQFFTITLCLISLQIGEYLKSNYSEKLLYLVQNCYILTTIAFAFQIIIQRFWILKTGHVIGHYAIMGGNRYAYSGLMGDYSFASLYLVTGAMLILLLYIRGKKRSFLEFFLIFSFVVFASILVSARTGIFSLAITIVLYFLFNFKKNSAKIFLLVILGMIALPFIFNFMTSIRIMDNLLDGSGRVELISKAWNIFLQHPVLGIGFGIDNLKYNYNLVVPHNFFVQYLLQFGIVGFGLLLSNFIVFYQKYKRNNYLMWLFVLCFIGAMLIPDIVSSRFLSTIMIMVIINSEEGGTYEKK